jgi:hypothetical protein
MCDRGKFVLFAQEQSVNLRHHLRKNFVIALKIRRASIEIIFEGEDTQDVTAAVFTYRILFAATNPVDGASDRWAQCASFSAKIFIPWTIRNPVPRFLIPNTCLPL